MKSVDTIARVRRAFYVQGWSLKRISRELHVSRNTVRRILRSGETSFSYERERQPQPKIGPWQVQLDALLDGNDAKQKRERLTLIRIYEELRALGYEGSYDAIRRYAKSREKARGAAMAEAYVPLFYPPGDAYQFDWSHEIVLINGVTVTVKVEGESRIVDFTNADPIVFRQTRVGNWEFDPFDLTYDEPGIGTWTLSFDGLLFRPAV